MCFHKHVHPECLKRETGERILPSLYCVLYQTLKTDLFSTLMKISSLLLNIAFPSGPKCWEDCILASPHYVWESSHQTPRYQDSPNSSQKRTEEDCCCFCITAVGLQLNKGTKQCPQWLQRTVYSGAVLLPSLEPPSAPRVSMLHKFERNSSVQLLSPHCFSDWELQNNWIAESQSLKLNSISNN